MPRALLFLLLLIPTLRPALAGPLVRFRTGLGDVVVELYDREKPITTSNFLAYVRAGRYTNMFSHRMVNNFVMQGGGFRVSNRGTSTQGVENVTAFPTIPNEFGTGARYSNLYGTLSMAKIGSYTNNLGTTVLSNSASFFPRLIAAGTNVVTYPEPFPDVAYTNFLTDRIVATNVVGNEVAWTVNRSTIRVGGGPDSASSQWFLSLNNNAANLDTQNGGFTVFGRVVGDLDVFNRLNTFLPVTRATNVIVNAGGTFAELPVLQYPVGQPGGPTPAQLFANLLYVDITELPAPVAPVPDPAGPTLGFAGVPGLTNRLEAASTPLGPWSEIGGFLGDGTVRRITDTSGAGTNRFYRVTIPTTLPKPL